MAFDGITIACLRKELSDRLVGGRITKIVQPEADELLLTIKNNAAQYRLLLSASASLPLVYLTEKNKNAPMTAPGFCMLLRKHLGGGRITAVTQQSNLLPGRRHHSGQHQARVAGCQLCTGGSPWTDLFYSPYAG